MSSERATGPDLNAASVIVSAGRPAGTPGAPVTSPVTFTSTYVAGGEDTYARTSNPTWTDFEAVIGTLERGQAVAFASGMAAISATVSLVPRGARVLAPEHAYSNTLLLLRDLAAAGDIAVTSVPIHDAEAVDAALAAHPDTALVWVESPSNPLLDVVDLPRLIASAHAHGALVAVDNTFNTPLLATPLTEGADVVVHSVTKYLAGHSDVVLGVAVAHADDLVQRLREHRTLRGAIPGPMEIWLALRGLRTLHLRVERSCANARVLAQRLGEHPCVQRVRYPGTGAIVAIEVGSAQRAEAVAAGVHLWTHATSLGGVESLIERRRRHAAEPVTVPADLLRLSVGIEDVDDLWRDLDQALTAAAGATSHATPSP